MRDLARIGFALASVIAVSAITFQSVLGSSTIEALYLNAERTDFSLLSESRTSFGIYNFSDVRGVVPETSIGAPATDCSDKKFLCFRFGFKGFAVPRSGLYDFSKYISGGIQFTVLHCYRRDQSRCAIALVQGDCQAKTDDGFCHIGQNGRKSNSGPVTYFIYNRRYGVVAFGSNPVPVDFILAEQAARVNLLQGDRGMLSE
jgi:hypothetical protein